MHFPNYFIGPLVCWSHVGSIVPLKGPSKCLMARARGRLVGIAKIQANTVHPVHVFPQKPVQNSRYIPCLLCGIPSQLVFRYSDKIDRGSASNDFAVMCTYIRRAMAALMMTS